MRQMSTSYITSAMSAAIGRVYERLLSFPISASDIRRWALAVYYPEVPPRDFWDAEYAATTRLGGIVAPHEFNPFAWMTAEPLGQPRAPHGAAIHRTETLLGIENPPLTKGLNGGLEVEYHARMRPGDVITNESTIESYDERDGRLGRMLISRNRSTWTNQNDELVKVSHFTLIRY